MSTIQHSYPYCWRSETPLIYKAVPSWFVKVESIKDNLLKNNQETYWVPKSVKEGRFHNWLENARDWAISRSRFWGTPIPIWMSDDGEEIVVIGSKQELEERSGQQVTPSTMLTLSFWECSNECRCRICTGISSISSLFHPSKARESCIEWMTCLTAGSKAEVCHTAKCTILLKTRSSSRATSRPTSLLKGPPFAFPTSSI